jgi:hypothetical protein
MGAGRLPTHQPGRPEVAMSLDEVRGQKPVGGGFTMVRWFFVELYQFPHEKKEFYEGKIVTTALDEGEGHNGVK